MLQLQRLTHFQQSLIISHGLALSSDHSKLASTLTILLHPVSVTSHSCPPEQNLTLTDKKITAKDRATQLADVSHQSRSQLFFHCVQHYRGIQTHFISSYFSTQENI